MTFQPFSEASCSFWRRTSASFHETLGSFCAGDPSVLSLRRDRVELLCTRRLEDLERLNIASDLGVLRTDAAGKNTESSSIVVSNTGSVGWRRKRNHLSAARVFGGGERGDGNISCMTWRKSRLPEENARGPGEELSNSKSGSSANPVSLIVGDLTRQTFHRVWRPCEKQNVYGMYALVINYSHRFLPLTEHGYAHIHSCYTYETGHRYPKRSVSTLITSPFIMLVLPPSARLYA